MKGKDPESTSFHSNRCVYIGLVAFQHGPILVDTPGVVSPDVEAHRKRPDADEFRALLEAQLSLLRIGY